MVRHTKISKCCEEQQLSFKDFLHTFSKSGPSARTLVKLWFLELICSTGGLLFFRQNCAEVRLLSICSPGQTASEWYPDCFRNCLELEATGLCLLEETNSPLLTSTSLWQGDLERGTVNPQTIGKLVWVCKICTRHTYVSEVKEKSRCFYKTGWECPTRWTGTEIQKNYGFFLAAKNIICRSTNVR